MLTWPDLYAAVLADPYRSGHRNLKVLTAYASPAFAHHVVYDFEELRLDLILGMAQREPVTVWDHNEYVRLVRETGRVRVRYYLGDPPIHSKILFWSGAATGEAAFVGSANFTWNGFRDYQEVMVPVDPKAALSAFPDASLLIDCTDPAVFGRIRMSYQKGAGSSEIDTSAVGAAVAARQCPSVELPLTDSRGRRVPARSGLNWGQRPELGREPNQAYIPIPRRVHQQKPGFFPERGREFTVITDDGESFVCVVAQDNDKAIETKYDNSILGRYFRRRLGVPPGAPVTLEDLKRYGRDYVTIYRIDDSTYFLDFSVKRRAERDS